MRTGPAVPKAGSTGDRFVELKGTPDLVVEIVSDDSFAKDTRRLPRPYFRAGIPEFWLIDARGERLRFEIHRRGKKGFEPVSPGPLGEQRSLVLRGRFVWSGQNRVNHWRYQVYVTGDWNVALGVGL